MGLSNQPLETFRPLTETELDEWEQAYAAVEAYLQALRIRNRLLAAELAKRPGNESERDWSRGLARLLGDREALDKALAEPRRLPQVPPGMPIGGAAGDWLGD